MSNQRPAFLRHVLTGLGLAAMLGAAGCSTPLIKSIEVTSMLTAPSDGTFWMQARPAALPCSIAGRAPTPQTVITLQKIDREGNHMYHGLEAMWSADLGKTWSGPTPLTTVDRIKGNDGLLDTPVDMTPQWHRQTGRLLVTGATFLLDPARKRNVPNGPSDTAYAVYNPETRVWNSWGKLVMPEARKYQFARAGCSQRVDLPSGDVLLPIYFKSEGSNVNYATVVRCRFDGVEMRYLEHGTELTVTNTNPRSRPGVHEPSLASFGNRYFLTLRNDERGYVTVSDDGLHFSVPQPWRFDDGTELGSYNTQQHWITHKDGLFLAYTRSGAGNDTIFRHRAPLFIARVNPEKLVVERATERVLLPNLGKAFGNFGVCNVTPDETWVVDCLVDAAPGTANVFLARIRWEKPNSLSGL